MSIVITCPRYFSEVDNLKKLIINSEYSVKLVTPKGQGFDAKEMKKNLQNSKIAIVGDDEINDDVINSCPNLELIIKWGVGTDNINISTKIPTVLNTPGDLHIDVAEHVIYLIGSLLKQIPYIHKELLMNTDWNKPIGSRLRSKNLGFIGFGRIAQFTAKLLKPFEVNIFYYDPYSEKLDNSVAQKKDLEFLQKTSDILIVTASLTKETRHLINKQFFNNLEKKPYIVNISRGQIINEEDLIYALDKQLISGCALDVFEKEPVIDENPLKNFNNVIFSTHNASNTLEANNSVNQQVTDTLLKWFSEQN